MPVKNYMEEIIDDEIMEIIKHIEMCKCEKCIDDIKAIALNNLEPKYFSTHKGEVYNKINELKTQFRVEIVKEVVKGTEIVKKHTMHKPE